MIFLTAEFPKEFAHQLWEACVHSDVRFIPLCLHLVPCCQDGGDVVRQQPRRWNFSNSCSPTLALTARCVTQLLDEGIKMVQGLLDWPKTDIKQFLCIQVSNVIYQGLNSALYMNSQQLIKIFTFLAVVLFHDNEIMNTNKKLTKLVGNLLHYEVAVAKESQHKYASSLYVK